MLVVAVAAAWISFSALTGLARMAHIWPPYLLPVAIDAYAVTSTRIWLTGTGPARAWARLNSFAAIGISIAGNAAYHGLASAGITRLPWQLAAGVAAVAPLTLWLVAHLHSLLTRKQLPAPVPVPAVPPTREAGAGTPTGTSTGTSTRERMKAHALAELAAGRAITGGQLDREFGTRDYGRKVLAEIRADSNGHAAVVSG